MRDCNPIPAEQSIIRRRLRAITSVIFLGIKWYVRFFVDICGGALKGCPVLAMAWYGVV